MIVRIDEQVHCKEDVLKLGIQPGDYICFDPKTVVTESGFLKSRFIDDKGSVTCLLTALKMMKDKGLKPHTRPNSSSPSLRKSATARRMFRPMSPRSSRSTWAASVWT